MRKGGQAETVSPPHPPKTQFCRGLKDLARKYILAPLWPRMAVVDLFAFVFYFPVISGDNY